ncbi:MAG: hypothetical protein ACE5KI_03975, partial [Dehalococcoidia bacterium]
IALDRDGLETGGVSYKWDVVDPTVGSIDQYGVFTAAYQTGVFPDVIRVEVEQGDGPDRQVTVTYASVGIIGELEKAAVQPTRAILRPGQSILFQVRGFDSNDLLVSPLRSLWSVEDPEAGSIDSSGLFTAGDQPGEYINVIKVVVTERGDR